MMSFRVHVNSEKSWYIILLFLDEKDDGGWLGTTFWEKHLEQTLLEMLINLIVLFQDVSSSVAVVDGEGSCCLSNYWTC